jgi:hypothetical protein
LGGSLFHDCLNAVELILNDYEKEKSNWRRKAADLWRLARTKKARFSRIN